MHIYLLKLALSTLTNKGVIMKAKLTATILMAFLFGVFANANAGLITYNDLGSFLADTGASAAAPFPDNGRTPVGSELIVGDLTFRAVDPSANIYSTDISGRIDGNEIARSDLSNFDIEITSGAVYSFGFEFVEPEFDLYVNAPFEESTFEVELFDGTDFRDSFTFSAPNDTAYFVGAWGDFAFDNITIREVVGGAENEFFGQFYTGSVSDTGPAPIPEPATVILLGGGLFGMAVYGMGRKKRLNS